MMRYKEISEIRNDARGNRYYSSLRYPSMPYRDTDIYLYGKRMMRLDLLAYKYYGDVTLWPIIARVNYIGKGTLMVPPGMRIRIPFPLSQADVIDKFYEINEIS